MKIPKVGDIIYLETELHLSHGIDDIIGGKARVVKVEKRIGFTWVTTEQNPYIAYAWEPLQKHQKSLKNKFTDQWAKMEPNYRPEFNEWY